jgi:hypothetical protein
MRLNAEMDKNFALSKEKYYRLDSLYNGNFISKNKLRKPFMPTSAPRNLNDFMQCTDIADMARRLGIPNILAFATALNPKFDAKNEADILALRETLSTQFQAKIAQNTASTTMDDVQYYLGTTNVRNNWYNCDALRKMAPELLATVRVNIQRDPQTDCKIILKNRKMALYSNVNTLQYVIPLVVKNEPAYIVAMRYTNKQAYIAIQPFTATNSAPTENINFEPVSITELRDKLLVLNSL